LEPLELSYKSPNGKVANELHYRHDEAKIQGLSSWDGRGASTATAAFPALAVHTSIIEPLPHQITFVYESMLPRQPLVAGRVIP
jgi:hypothetical protein